MAHKKAGGSTSLGRDSHGKRLGVKINHGEFAKQGAIIVRQRGTKIHPGENVARGGDDTLFATTSGIVNFFQKKRTRFDKSQVIQTFVSVIPVNSQKLKKE